MNTTFLRIGSMNGQKQVHRNEKRAPASRGIWMLPQKLGRDLIYLGYGNWIPEEKLMDKKYMCGKIHKINLSMNDYVWHHIEDKWEKCSVKEYFCLLYKKYGQIHRIVENMIQSNKTAPVTHYLDGERFEVFYEC